MKYILDEKRKLHGHCNPIEYEVDSNDCWNCVSHKIEKDGYPRFIRDQKSLRISRYVYEIYVEPIKKGNIILHSCDNPRCINPSHLSQGTWQDNMTDRNNKRRQAYGERNGNVKLSEEQVVEIKKLIKERDMTYREISIKYNVSRVLIQKIASEKLWSHI